MRRRENKSAYRLVVLTIVAVLVVLATVGVGWGIGDVTAQESETTPQEGVAGSAAESDINLVPRTEEGEKVTMEVGETLSVGVGAEEENWEGTVIAEAEDKYLWRIHRTGEGSSDDNQLLYTESSDLPELDGEDQPNSARVTSFRPTKPGNYVIEVETPNVETFRSDSAEGPHIGHTVEIEVSPSQDKNLLKKHSPVLNFHPDEMYYPTRIEAIVDNSYLCDDEPPGAQGDLVYDMATLKDMSGGGTSLYTQPYALEERQVSIRGCNTPVISGSFPASVLTEYNPSNSVYPESVYGTVIEPGDRPIDNLSFSPGDEHVSDYQNAGFEPPSEGGNYTVLVYFMTYVNDPKPENAQGLQVFDELAGHTGDVEPVWILLEDGEPEWLLAQQHLGGEYRKWENIEKENGHPVIYPAEGAHSNFLGIETGETDAEVRTVEDTHSTPLNNPSDYPQYIYQQQYFCPKLCDGPRGDTTIAEVFYNDIDNYIDVIGFSSSSGSREGEVWIAEESDVTVSSDEEYEISVLTGNEVWSDYEGDLYRYANIPRTEGDVHHQTTTWQNPGGRGEDVLFPDVAQIEAEFTGEDDFVNIGFGEGVDDADNIQDNDLVIPDGRDFGCDVWDTPCLSVELPPAIVTENDEIDPNEADGSVGVNVINTGMQPHEFTLNFDAGSIYDEADYSFYVNSIYPKNVAGAKVPLEPLGITEEGTYDVDAALSVYPDDYQLDSEEFEITIGEALDPSIEITNDETIDAGNINRSRIVDIDVSAVGRDLISSDRSNWKVFVGGEEASFSGGGSVTFDGEDYRVAFRAPEKETPGTYDVRIEYELDDETLSDEKEDLLAYGEPGEVTSTATALVLDNSGSMGARDVGGGSRIGAAKDAAVGVINRQSDSDYVSVVGFSSGSSVRQGLTQLDEGRGSAQSAVTSMGAGGSTNIGAGLRDGIDEVMEAPEGTQKNIILMSDGGRNTGPSESAIRGMVRNRMNPNGICLQTNSLGDGADVSFMNSLDDAADCSESTESDSRDEIIQDFINLTRGFDASELIDEIESSIGGGDTFEGTFGIGEDTTNAILDIATGTGVSGLEVKSESTEGEIDVDDNRSDAELNASGTSIESIRTGTLDSPAPEDRDVRLYRPNGSIVDPKSDPDVEVSSTGDRTVYRINDPEAGEWSYEIDGGDGGTDFEAVITADSLAKMDVDTSSDEYYTGSSATLTATLFGSVPVTDADIEAVVEAPDGTSETVTLEEVSAGIYRATVDLEEGVSGTYKATVKGTKEDENIERRATTSWDAEFAAPVSVRQSNIPEIESGGEGEMELSVESEALLGIRSVGLGISDFTHEGSDATVPGSSVSMDGSYLIQSGGSVPVDATVSVPDSTPSGVYTAEASAQIDDSGTTVNEVEIRVGGGTSCVNRRDVGRGETDEQCPDDRDLSRGGTSDGSGRYGNDERRRNRGRGSDGRGANRRGGGR